MSTSTRFRFRRASIVHVVIAFALAACMASVGSGAASAAGSADAGAASAAGSADAGASSSKTTIRAAKTKTDTATKADTETNANSATSTTDTTDITAGTTDTIAAKTGLKTSARVTGKGWMKPVKSGKIAGVTTKPLKALAVTLVDPTKIGGHIKYRTYDAGTGWGAIAKDGASSGQEKRSIRCVKIWLTDNIAAQYDVKYRVYLKGKGWLSWVRNRAAAGNAEGKRSVTAIQVKIVPKPKDLLNGIDIASWQAGLNPATVDADFIIAKSTEGTWYTNPYFKKWADATLASGKLLGTYHFIRDSNAVKQADYFVDTVGDYIGKCVLFLDWEDRPDIGEYPMSRGPKFAKKFLDRVYERTGVKPLIYTSKSVCRNYDWKTVASTYGLWVAQYAYKYQDNGTGYLSDPWTDDLGWGAWAAPTLFQYTSNGWISGYGKCLDLNLFYGSRADWKKLQKKS